MRGTRGLRMCGRNRRLGATSSRIGVGRCATRSLANGMRGGDIPAAPEWAQCSPRVRRSSVETRLLTGWSVFSVGAD